MRFIKFPDLDEDGITTRSMAGFLLALMVVLAVAIPVTSLLFVPAVAHMYFNEYLALVGFLASAVLTLAIYDAARRAGRSARLQAETNSRLEDLTRLIHDQNEGRFHVERALLRMGQGGGIFSTSRS